MDTLRTAWVARLAARGTVASVTPNGQTRGVIVTFTNGLQVKTSGVDEVTVHRETVFLPEPCEQCDNGQPCETHAPALAWADSWLHPNERKHAPTLKEWND